MGRLPNGANAKKQRSLKTIFEISVVLIELTVGDESKTI